jgi:anhydro-N-acetylmuramic acid kinase
MSGTSMDGVDAALVEMDRDAETPEVKLLAFRTVPYPEELRSELLGLATGLETSVAEVASLNTSVAVAFANAFFSVCESAGIKAESVHFIGSHGQTVAHVPPGGREPVAGTFQLGSPGMIAALTGVTTVGDFRPADMALGGHGAPLAPYVDYLLRRSDRESRVVLNVGGIANVTYLPRGTSPEQVLAFDTGPGNMVVDELFRALFPGSGDFDRDGRRASEGRVDELLVERYLKAEYFAKTPPKSAGHGEFGPPFAWEFLAEGQRRNLRRVDILASAVMLTVKSIAQALERFVRPKGSLDVVYVSGGGARNSFLMDRLREALTPVPVRPIDELGIPAEAKEAVDFAVLARETLLGRPNVIPQATGAARSLVLGSIALGRPSESEGEER